MVGKNSPSKTSSHLPVFKIQFYLAALELSKVWLHPSNIKDQSYPGRINPKEQKFKLLLWFDETLHSVDESHHVFVFQTTV